MSRSSPPDPRLPDGSEDDRFTGPTCPFCDSTDVEIEAPFGGSLMTSQFWCRRCRTVFERVKWDKEESEAGDWLDE